MRTALAPHIQVDPRGIANLDDTETKVLTVVLNKRMSRDTPEQLRELGQVHNDECDRFWLYGRAIDHRTQQYSGA